MGSLQLLCVYKKMERGPLSASSVLCSKPSLCASCSPSHILLVRSSISPPNSSAPGSESPSFDPDDRPPYPLLVLLLTSCLLLTLPCLSLSSLLHLPGLHLNRRYLASAPSNLASASSCASQSGFPSESDASPPLFSSPTLTPVINCP